MRLMVLKPPRADGMFWANKEARIWVSMIKAMAARKSLLTSLTKRCCTRLPQVSRSGRHCLDVTRPSVRCGLRMP